MPRCGPPSVPPGYRPAGRAAHGWKAAPARCPECRLGSGSRNKCPRPWSVSASPSARSSAPAPWARRQTINAPRQRKTPAWASPDPPPQAAARTAPPSAKEESSRKGWDSGTASRSPGCSPRPCPWTPCVSSQKCPARAPRKTGRLPAPPAVSGRARCRPRTGARYSRTQSGIPSCARSHN